MIKAAAYARFSSDNQREESIEAQLYAIRKYAEENNLQIVYEYTDEAKSATTDNRPGFLRMIDDSALHKWEVVIVHKLDRFSRNRYDSAIYKRTLQKNGVTLVSVLERLDDSPESIILESLLTGMSEYYSANLSREVKKGLQVNGRMCIHNGGRPPLGYDVDADRHYIVNQEEADAVRIIFRMYGEGCGYSEIIRTLSPYRTKSGGKFGKNSIHDILENEKYRGVYTFNSDEKIRVEGGMPRIITDEEWQAVQWRLHDNKRNASNRAKVTYLLSGKLICAKCGCVMCGKSSVSRGRVSYKYICGKRERAHACDMKAISKHVAEDLVLAEIDRLVQGIDLDAAAAAIEPLFTNEEPEEVTRAKEELQKNKVQQRNLVSVLSQTGNNPYVIEELNRLGEMAKILEEKTRYVREKPTREEIKKVLLGLVNIYEKSQQEQKKIINRAIERIVFDGEKLEIFWRIQMDANTMVEAGRTQRYALFSTLITYPFQASL